MAEQLAAGLEDRAALQAAGFSDEELTTWQKEQTQQLQSAGFSNDEVNAHWGASSGEPDLSPIKGHIQKNMDAFHSMLQGATDQIAPQAEALPPSEPTNPNVINLGDIPAPKEVTSTLPKADGKFESTGPTIGPQAPSLVGPTPAPQPGPEAKKPPTLIDAIEAGFQMSVTGLMTRGKAPDIQLPQDAPAYLRIAQNVTALIADGPEYGIGGLVGAAAGTAVAPGLGTAAGAGAASFALPAAMRTMLMEHYEKGDIKTFSDFWERSSAVFLNSLKEGTVGALTAGVGGAAAEALSPLAKPVVATAGVMASQVATMVGLGAAMEGKVPKLEDIGDAAATVLLMHGFTHITKPIHEPVMAKMRDIYAKTGVSPAEVAAKAGADPLTRQELFSDTKKLPTAFQAFEEKLNSPTPPAADVPKHLLERNPVLAPNPVEDHVTIEPVAQSVIDNDRGSLGSRSPVEPKTELGKAVKDILDHVHTKPDSKGEPVNADRLYEGIIDGLDPLNKLMKDVVVGDPLPAKDDFYKIARLQRNAGDKARAFLRYGVRDFNDLSKVESPGLREILAPFKSPEDRANLTAYLVARRSVELEERGITPGSWKSESSQLVVDKLEGRYGKAAEQLTNFENSALKYLKDSGRISEESFNKIKAESKNHVPFHRITEEGNAVGGSGKSGPKRIKGSESDIVDPVESIVRNTHAYIQMAESNRVASTVIELIKNSPEGRELVRPAAKDMVPLKVHAQEISDYLKSMGMEESDAAHEAFTVFRNGQKDVGENQIVHWEDGKPKLYDTDPGVARAFKTLDGNVPQTNFLVKLLKLPASTLRSSLAFTPDFIARHWIRNQFVANTFVQKYKGIPVLEHISMLKELFKEQKPFQDFLVSGGGNGALTAVDQKYVENDVWELSKKTGLIDSFRNVITHPLASLHAAATLMDNATRFAEFKRVGGENPTHNDYFEGGYAAREIIPDPLRRGGDPNVKLWDQISPFTNLRFQGIDKIARSFKDDPVGMTARVATTLTLPSLALWAYHQHQIQDPTPTGKDGATFKERWDNISRVEKDLCWIFMTQDYDIRIPKPFELGILFATLPELIVDKFVGENPKAFKDFSGVFFGGAFPSLLPAAVTPFVEQFANKSTFSGHDLVPAPLAKLLPRDQATPWTTQTAQILGGILEKFPVIRDMGPEHTKITSPIVLENYTRAWAGNLGMYALKTADQALIQAHVIPDPIKPESTIAEWPFVKAFFIREPSAGAQQIQDFFERAREHDQMIAHQKFLLAKGDVKSLQKDFGPDQPENRERLVSLEGFKTALGAQSAMIQKITQNPKMNPTDKRQQIDKLLWGMIREATAANKLLDTIHQGNLKKGNP